MIDTDHERATGARSHRPHEIEAVSVRARYVRASALDCRCVRADAAPLGDASASLGDLP